MFTDSPPGSIPGSSTKIAGQDTLKRPETLVKGLVKEYGRRMASLRKRARADGTVAYAVLYSLNGQQTSTTFDEEASAEQFRKAVDTIGAEKALKAWDITPIFRAAKQRSNAPTVKAWLKHYIDTRSGVMKSTIFDYESYLEHDIAPTIGDIPIDLLTPDDVAAWVQKLSERTVGKAKRPISGKTLANRHGFLSAGLNTAVRAGHIPSNPALGTRIPRSERAEMCFLDHTEFELLKSCFQPHYRPMLDFMVASAARFGELSALRPSDVDQKRGTVYIGRAWKRTYREIAWEIGVPKTKRSVRTISVDKKVLETLDYSREWLFTTNKGNPVRAPTFRNNFWYPAVAKARDKGLMKSPRIHDMRHTSASWLVQAGTPLPVVQAHLGHESINTTIGLYTHLDRASADAAAGVLSRALLAARDESPDEDDESDSGADDSGNP